MDKKTTNTRFNEAKNYTHIIFHADGKNYAVPINDLHMSAIPGKAEVTITNLVTDTIFRTSKIRAAMTIEAVKFINGRFDPFAEMDPEETH